MRVRVTDDGDAAAGERMQPPGVLIFLPHSFSIDSELAQIAVGAIWANWWIRGIMVSIISSFFELCGCRRCRW